MKKVFISGRISDMSDLSHFCKAEDYLIIRGDLPVSPIGLISTYKGIPDDTDNKEEWVRQFWLREAIRLLLTCDAIYFCPGRKSSGMKLEKTIADAIGLEIIT